MDALTTNTANEPELDFQDFASVVRQWRWYIFLIVLVWTIGTAIAAYVLPKKYSAVVLISPVSNSSTNGLLSGFNSMVSQFSGLASLAGISESSADSSKAESLAVLQSESLTEQYIQQQNLLPVLFPGKWDARRNRWIETEKIPTLWQGNQYFKKKVRSVSSDTKSGLVTLTITWTDPVVAAKWANDLVRLTNQYRREKAITEAQGNVIYLTGESAKTDVLGVKEAIYNVLQSEISKMMLANGNEEYALKVIDPAFAPEKPSSPIPIVWIPAGFAGSLGLCLMAAFLRTALGSKEHLRHPADSKVG